MKKSRFTDRIKWKIIIVLMVGMVVVALFLQAGILMYVNSKNADKTSQMLLDQAISIIEKNQENEKDLLKSMKEDYIVRARAVAYILESSLSSWLKHLSADDQIVPEDKDEYLAKTDPLGANVPNPVSHVAYGYATQVCIIDSKTGKIEKMIAAHDVGKAVNPLSCEGQIEGGVVMSMGYALREQYPIDENCKPIDKYGSLRLFRSHEIPEIEAIVIDKPGLNVACGAIGIGEIT